MLALPDTTPRTAARVAGLGYAALFALAVFANFVVRMGLVVPDDPAATVENLAADEQLFRIGLAAFVIVFLVDVAVAWALHLVLRPAGPARSLVAAWFRLAYTVFLGVGAAALFLALQFATGSSLDGLDPAQRESLTMVALDLFDYTWLVGLAAFGVHLALVGRMLMSAALGPRLLGIALVVAGAAYLVDTLAATLLTDYGAVEGLMLAIVAVPSIVAELALTVWLLRRGWRPGGDASALRPSTGRASVAAT